MVPSGSGKGVPWAVGIYEAQPRRADGVLTWRLIENPAGYTRGRDGKPRPAARWSYAAALRDAEALAAQRNLPLLGIRHGMRTAR